MANSSQMLTVNGGYDLITGAGTALAGATALTGGMNLVTANTGATAVLLPAQPGGFGNAVVVHNAVGSTGAGALVFPPTSAGTINGGSAGASFSVAPGKTAIFFATASGVYIAMLGA